MIRTLDWIPGYRLKTEVVTGLEYMTDWLPLGRDYDAVVFVVVNQGANPVTVTPEASENATDVEVGPTAPEPMVLAAGTAGRLTYTGVDMRGYWRLALNATNTTALWGLKGVRRAG